MARYVSTVQTSRTPEEAFAFMADVPRFSAWDPGVSHGAQAVGAGLEVGSAFDLTIRSRVPMVLRYVVVACEPPRRFTMIAETMFLRSVDEIVVEPGPAGAVVTYDATLTLRGPLGLFDGFLARAFKAIGDRADAGLRQALG